MAAKQVIVYRRQPWEHVDQLVYDMCPDGFDVVTLARDASPAERQEKLATADFLMGSWVTTAVTLTEDDFRAGPHLKLLQLMSAGWEHIDLDLAARYGVPVAHFGGSNASIVAEHTIMALLALYRQLRQLDSAVRSGAWRAGDPPLYELKGKRIGLIGLGYIGREVAQRLAGFGCEVVYFARHRVVPSLEERLGVAYMSLDELLSSSDAVSLHVPLTSATRHLIGPNEMARMKPGAVLINTTRGPVVDEPALVDALRSGHLGGAALDVLEQEPPAAANPLLAMDNVLLSPHISGTSVELWPRVVATCYANIQRVARGEPPQHLATKLE